MAVEKMCMMTLTGPVDLVDEVIGGFVVNREFHPENALSALGGKMELLRIEGADPYASSLARVCQITERLGIETHSTDFVSDGYSVEKAEEYVLSVTSRVLSLISERQRLVRYCEECDTLAVPILHLIGISEKLSDLLNMKYVKFRYGKISSGEYPACLERISARDDSFAIETGESSGWTYMMYFVLPRTADVVDAFAGSMGFVRIPIDPSLKNAGTAADENRRLTGEIEKSKRRIEEIDAQLTEIKAEETRGLLAAYSCLRFHSEAFSLRSFAARIHDKFFLIGWIPARLAEEYTSDCERLEGVSCFAADAEEIDFAEPPTKLRNCLLGRIFHPFVNMYGLPAYDEIDPTMFMAVTYILFFGSMFGDVGHGLCLALAGFAIKFWKKNWLGGIIACCGFSGMLFGFVYGSVFGFEELLPGFKILEGQNVTVLMIISLALGAVMIAVVMILNIANGIRRRDWERVLFSANGVSGLVFYLGIILAAVSKLVFGINLFRAFYVLPVLVLPLLLIMLHEPLGHLVNARTKPEEKQSVGNLLSTGFFEVFETALSYLTNTLSFLRVGAYAITHVGLMLVVQMLAGESRNIVVIILGNAFVVGFEGLLVGIQVLRLEFYELFGRFYGSGGREFRPHVIDY